MRGVGRGSGKLLLLGEHAAVYGHPAVGLSLEEFVQADLELSGRRRWRVEGVGPDERAAVREVLAVCEELLPQLREHGRGRITLGGSIQRGLGFGSSAALCVAVSGAFHSALREAVSTIGEEAHGGFVRRVWAVAHQAERLFHGTPSGIDTGLSLLGGLYWFEPRPPDLPEAHRLRGLPLDLVIGAVPRSSRAGALIGSLGERMRGGDRETQRRLDALGGLASRGIEVLQGDDSGRLEELGDLCWRAGDLLAELGLMTPELARLLEEGRACGAVGGKVSGAGGGGAFFLLFRGPEEAAAAAPRLRWLARSLGLSTAESIRTFSRPTSEGGAT